MCTYTGETELSFCNMNMDYAVENHLATLIGLYADKITLSIPEGTHF
jgi:hypothetical protein